MIVNTRFLHRPMSGVERYASEILKRLEMEYHPVAPAGPKTGYLAHLWEQVQLPRLLKRGDLLWSPANTGPVLVSRQVVHVYDLSPIDHPQWFKPAFAAWYRRMWTLLLPRARAIITASRFSKDRLVAYFGLPDEKVHVIPGGVGQNFKPSKPAECHAICQRYRITRPYVLFVGTLEPRKNLDGLLKAWPEVLKHHPGYQLTICGSEAPIFHSNGIEAIPGNTRIISGVPDRDLPALYSAAVCLVLPSWYEGFGLPVLEAMACGTPVIIARAGALPEVAGDAALLGDPHDPHSLAEAVCRLIEDGGLQSELAARGRARAAGFSWEHSAAGVRRVLEQAWSR